MDIFAFIVLSFCNVALIIWIIRRQGINSVEGYCAAFLLLAVLGDNVSLLFHYIVQPQELLLGAEEFNFRLYPTLVHIVALIALMIGLYLGNPRPDPVGRDHSESECDFLAYTGVVLIVVGLILSLFAVYFTDAYKAQSYFTALDDFRAGTPGATGGFWYRGADIATFGMALVLPGLRKTGKQFFFLVFIMMLIAFFLTANKGGFERAILWAAVVLYTYNPQRMRLLAKPRNMLLALVVILLGLSFKVTLLQNEDWTLESLSENITEPLGARWSDQGLYRGYCQFVNLLPQYHYLFEGYKIGRYALTEAWIPRAINPNKAAQPTAGFGFMIHPDFHEFKDETPSLELVGSVYADNGLYTAIIYLLITGFLLGMLRHFTTSRSSTLQWHISYLCFAIFQGLSAESGILGTVYTFLLTFTATGLAHLLVIGLYKRKLYLGATPIGSVAGDSLSPI